MAVLQRPGDRRRPGRVALVLAQAARRPSARSYDFRLPDGLAGVGVLQVSVTTDINNNVFEYLSGVDAEANNDASISVTSHIAQYADLQVRDLALSPASPQSGNAVTLTW